jgi:acyl transferase domain-containing protein/aryl carrier-like protein
MFTGSLSAASLTDISYTLLAGRHHFRHRSAIVVHNRAEALQQLKQWSAGQMQAGHYHGEILHDFRAQAAINQYITELSEKATTGYGDLAQYEATMTALAAFYCQGYELPADTIYTLLKPQRIHMPVYPFVRDRYWIQPNTAAITTPPQVLIIKEATNGHDQSLLFNGNGNGNGNGHATHKDVVSDHGDNKTYQYLATLLASIIGLPAEAIEPDAQFSNYGIDSILIMQIKNRLEEIIGELPTGLFYEYPTLRTLVQYFVTEHPAFPLTVTEQQHN